ncbi:MAG: family 78 glycoside hydrolase catalytic domain, partial [Acidobacteriaceae bacterium]
VLLASTIPCLPAIAAQPTQPMQWRAQWIAAQTDSAAGATPNPRPLPIFRDDFNVSKKISRATLYISGLGQFQASINGRNVTDTVLNPAWSDYRKRVFYCAYDVTQLLQPGANAIGVMLGNGMYNVPETPQRYQKFHGSFGQPKLTLQLQIEFADGTRQTIASDGQWKTSPGPITFDSIYGGEDYDTRLNQPGWDRPGFNDARWSAVAVVAGPGGKLVPETIPPIKLFDRYNPVKITHPKPGIAVYDLGENFAGWPEIAVHGPRGSRVKLIPGELLDARGLVTQWSANGTPNFQNSFTYVLKGGAPESWHPLFTYYGFRYVQVETTAAPHSAAAGTAPHLPVLDRIDGRFLHDAVQIDGGFHSSDELLNRIHTLITRAMLSNMMSVLTDCPQREKLGWLEQSHLAAASLMYNYNLRALYAKIADDMQDAQLPNGLVPDIAPEYTVFVKGYRDSPEWGSAVVLSTWTAYQFYGDRSLLHNHYNSMQRYVAYLHSRLQGNLLTYGLGDWFDIGPKSPGESQLTTKGVTATATYYQDLTTISRIATLLGHPADAAAYNREANAVKSAFNARFFHPKTNEYDTGSQTANAMPLVVGMVPDGRQNAVLNNLIADIRRHNNHVTAGDIGFHYVVRALTDNNRSDVLFDMLSRTDNPSYGYQLAHGATTLTEAWDADPSLSQNHFMLGHAEEWFYRGLAGIDFDRTRAADRRILIHPAIVGNVRNAAASFQSSLGEIKSSWSRTGNTLNMEIEIPDGATATILFPPAFRKSITVNGHPLSEDQSIRSIHLAAARPSCIVKAGT